MPASGSLSTTTSCRPRRSGIGQSFGRASAGIYLTAESSAREGSVSGHLQPLRQIGDSVDRVKELTLRAATAADSSMLYDLHKATMQHYVEAIYGPWDDKSQRARLIDWLRHSHPQIIQYGTEPVGVIDWEWRLHELYLGRIEVRPDLQGSGIGTRVLRHLAATAAAQSKPLVLEVIDVNPARQLYERLGFEPFKTVGRKVHMRMDTSATGASNALTARLREI